MSAVALILAAGKGTRMKSDLPKVAVPLAGKPLLVHVIESLVAAGIKSMVIVVGHKKEVVQDLVPDLPGVDIRYAEQTVQKGTAHAVLAAADALKDFSGELLVTCGDMPRIRPDTFQRLLSEHGSDDRAATICTAKLDDPYPYGRIVRSANGTVEKIVEEKDADAATKKIQEVNSGTYVFRSPEIFQVLGKIDSQNSQQEYYLTDVVALYRERGEAVGAVLMEDAEEVLGVNSKEDLEALEKKILGATADRLQTPA